MPRPNNPPNVNRFRALVTIVTCLALVGVSGCRAWRVSPVSPEELVRTEAPTQVRVTTTQDTARMVLYQPTIVGDSLRGLPTELAIRPRMVPLASITEIATKHFSLKKTALSVAAIAAGVLVYDWLMSLNQTSP